MGWGHRGGVSEESSLVLSPPLPGGDSVVPQARRGLTAAGSPRPRLSLTVPGLCLRQRLPLAFWGKSCFSEGFSHRKARAGLSRTPLHPQALPLQERREFRLRGFAAVSTGEDGAAVGEPSPFPSVGTWGCRALVDGRAGRREGPP